MHPRVFAEFETICSALQVTGKVLEIGASPHHRSLLEMEALRHATLRLGVGIDGEIETPRFRIARVDAHDLSCFAAGTFDLVVCNAMLEHDARFWLSAAEARRVAAPGGWIVLGVPGFGAMGTVPGARTIRLLSRLLLIGNRWRTVREALEASSAVLGLHDFPGDFYRFSEQAMTQVLLEGLEAIETRAIMNPPRIIGIGRKPGGRA